MLLSGTLSVFVRWVITRGKQGDRISLFLTLSQVLVKHGAIIAIANKYGETPLSKARPRLRKKLECKQLILEFCKT